MKKYKITSFQRMPLWFRRLLLNWVFPDYEETTDELNRLNRGLVKLINKEPYMYPDNPHRLNLENLLLNRDRKPRPMFMITPWSPDDYWYRLFDPLEESKND